MRCKVITEAVRLSAQFMRARYPEHGSRSPSSAQRYAGEAVPHIAALMRATATAPKRVHRGVLQWRRARAFIIVQRDLRRTALNSACRHSFSVGQPWKL